MERIFIIVYGLAFVVGFILLYYKLARSGNKQGTTALDEMKTAVDQLNKEKSVLEERARMLQDQLDQSALQTRDKDAAILQLNNKLTASVTEYNNLLKRLDEQNADLEKLQDKFRVEFKNLANEILEEKTQKFTEQNKIKLDEILKPLGEKIRDFEKKVEETYDKESKQRFSLEREIKNLTDLNQQISKEASNLTNALKGQAKTRGNWGEIILESILEKSGLTL
ncbi:MAG: DNA recombination protein RmuC, partial [Bacteroidales bacterium]